MWLLALSACLFVWLLALLACWVFGFEHFALVGSQLWAFRLIGLSALGISSYQALRLEFLGVISSLKFKFLFNTYKRKSNKI